MYATKYTPPDEEERNILQRSPDKNPIRNQEEQRDKDNINTKGETDSNNLLFHLWYKEIKDKVKGNWNQWKDNSYEGKKISRNVQIEIEVRRIGKDR